MSSEKSIEKISEIDSEKKQESPPKVSQEFLQKIGDCNRAEDKIRFCLDQMRDTLSQDQTPRFKDFWEIRRFSLPLFKENIRGFVRSALWKEFIELTTEARRLKEILDEQVAFTLEQIDLAICGLEKEVSHYEEIKEKTPKPDLPKSSKTLSCELDSLCEMQKEINLLTNMIQRLNELRKELIAQEMRIRFKNKFFKRLTSLGDFLFPKRKELIQNLSTVFLQSVTCFVEEHFKENSIKIPYYTLREEIKAIQSVSKELNLNNKVFTETRKLLSNCWDQVKDFEKEKKKEIQEKRAVFEENKQKVQERVDQLSQKSENLSYDAINQEIIEIHKFMRTLELGREEVKDLKLQLKEIKVPFEEKRRKEELEKRQIQKKQLQEKLEELENLKEEINKCLDQAYQVEELQQKIKEFHDKVNAFALTKTEKQTLDRALKPLKDHLAILKEKALIASLSEDEIKSLEKLKSVLDERKERKKEIKRQLENYRKELSGSGFDFEKAMMYREIIDAEKKRLEKAEEGILEIEEKIAELEGR